ncbi:MAG: hypothetical protein ACLVJX_06340 [Merdibacter sp.]
MNLFFGLMVPFIGTVFGAACVFILRGELNPRVQKMLLGFASGVMVAASIWSLLIPAMDMSAEWGSWLSCRQWRFSAGSLVFAAAGLADSTSASGQRRGGGA